MERHKRRWSVIYEGDVGSGWEWCQIKLHTTCDVPATLNQLKTTVVDGARSIFAPAVVVIYKFFNFFSNFFLIFLLIFAKNTHLLLVMGQKKKSLVVFSLSKRGRTMMRPRALVLYCIVLSCIVLYVLYLNLVYSHLPAVANTPPPRVWIMRGDSLSPN